MIGTIPSPPRRRQSLQWGLADHKAFEQVGKRQPLEQEQPLVSASRQKTSRRGASPQNCQTRLAFERRLGAAATAALRSLGQRIRDPAGAARRRTSRSRQTGRCRQQQTSLATAKSKLSAAAVMAKAAGSIKGEASQNAMTGAIGVPSASRPAMNGMTSHEQNGERPPIKAARMIMRTCRPTNALATIASAPLAFR